MIPGIVASVISGAAPDTLEFHAPLLEDLVDVAGSATPTFTRATVATVIDDNGDVVSVASGEARFTGSQRNAENDWTATGSSIGILIEEEGTNYADTDDDLTGGAETVDLTSPGTGNYTLSVMGTAAVTVAAGTATGSGFGQATEGSNVTFNLSGAGTVTLTLDSGSLDAHGGGYVKQVETGAFATSFILASGGGVTRNADVLKYAYQPPALVGSMLLNCTSIRRSGGTYYMLGNNSVARWIYGTGSRPLTYDGGSTVNYANLNFTTGATNKIGLSYEDGASPERATYVAGSQQATGAMDADGYVSGTDPLGIGNRGDNGSGILMNGNYSNVKFYTDAKDQTFMEAATT